MEEKFIVIKDTKGFTLIEVILVVSILSFLFSIPVLNTNYLLKFVERKEINELKEDIYYSRNRAIVESKIYSVDILVDKNSYAIYTYDTYRKLIKSKKLKGNLKIKYTTIKNDELMFGYLGIPIETGTIVLTNNRGEEIKIAVTPVTAKINVYIE
jgi:prepilin-type N-terminal cleavage/methylation domain-containing protein